MDGYDGANGAGEGALQKSARNQLIFREVNERIAELTVDWNDAGVSLFICECSDRECSKALEIKPAEYEQVRADGARFVVAPSHERSESDRVVERCARFLVIEKAGAAAEAARASDPRGHA
jgi:hypothetical protein